MAEDTSPPTVVLFDLGGTLADTFADLEWALAWALDEQGLAPGDRRAVRPQVSRGARAMTEAALAPSP
jgi:phosphoglycolate phosphatase-like HAD superfamily hydrolase